MGKLITSVKKFSDLADAIRSGHACIPVTRLAGGDACVPDPYYGSLVVEGDHAEMRLRTHTGSDDFATARKVLENDYEEIEQLTCEIDGHMEVAIRKAFGRTVECSGIGSIHQYTFNEIVEEADHPHTGPARKVHMVAKIARSKLHYHNLTQTTRSECSLQGEVRESRKHEGLGADFPPYQYKITNEDDDILICVNLLDGNESTSVECDQRILSALILMFVWLNGGHPYVYCRAHFRQGSLISRSIQPLQSTPDYRRMVLPRHTGGNVVAGIMDAGISFFKEETQLAKDLRLFLWQYRDATPDDSITLGMLLQGCSLLEGLVGLTLRHSMNLGKPAIDKLPTPDPSKNHKGTAEARFFHAGKHLEFDWDRELGPVFRRWQEVRNALAHGNLSEFDKRDAHWIIDSYRQIIQAFNAFALRLIGYKGRVCMDQGWFAAGE